LALGAQAGCGGDHWLAAAVDGVDENQRAATVATVWHYFDADAAPRLVTAYPTP
jgi:hypothetical protein